MSTTLGTRRHARAPEAPRSTAVSAVATGLLPAIVGLVVLGMPAVISWLVSSHPACDTGSDCGGSWRDAVGAGALTWLTAHGLPVTISQITYTLLPWGFLVIPLVFLAYSGRRSARHLGVTTVTGAVKLALGAALTYAACIGIVVVLSGVLLTTPASEGGAGTVAPTRAVLQSFVIVLPVLLWSTAGGAGVRKQLLGRIPAGLRAASTAALAGVLTLICAGAVLTAVAYIWNIQDVATVASGVAADPLGGALLGVICAGYAPVLVMWGTSYLLGPGFAPIHDQTVSPLLNGMDIGAMLPGVPPYAAIPTTQVVSPTVAVAATVVAGLVAGFIAGRVLLHRVAHLALVLVPLTGFLGAVAMAFLCQISTGSLGTQRLAGLGPSVFPTAAIAGGLIGIGCLVSVLLHPHDHHDSTSKTSVE